MLRQENSRTLLLAPLLAAACVSCAWSLLSWTTGWGNPQIDWRFSGDLRILLGMALGLTVIGIIVAVIANAVFGSAWRTWARIMRWEHWSCDAFVGGSVAFGLTYGVAPDIFSWDLLLPTTNNSVGLFPVFSWGVCTGALTGVLARKFATQVAPTQNPATPDS